MKVGKEIIGKLKREVEENQKKYFVPFQSKWKGNFIQSQVDVEDGDRLAVQVSKVFLQFSSINSFNGDSFETLLNQLKKTVTYLPENLKIVEIDKTNSAALLCSEKPFEEKQATEYFKLKINNLLEVSLQRIRNINHKNVVIPFVISYDILERFIKDCAEIVTGILKE